MCHNQCDRATPTTTVAGARAADHRVGKLARHTTETADGDFPAAKSLQDSCDELAPSREKTDPTLSRDRQMPLLVFIEGGNDIQFLTRISRILHAADSNLPDLAEMECEGKLAFVPFGGSTLNTWIDRLAGLGCPEFHLYDREIAPATSFREEMAHIVNRRSHCRAALTHKRSIECYLHPQAILEASGIEMDVADDSDVADLAAQQRLLSQRTNIVWSQLSARGRRRLRNSAKRWLNTSAVNAMSVDLLAERDAAGEVVGWLKCIREMLGGR